METLRERTAVVTGAASGIGRGLATALAREGMQVVLADVEAPALEVAASALADSGARTLAVVTDVRSPESVEALAARSWERFGGVHLVCSNAGVFQGGVLWERTLEDWEWVLGVNLWGGIHMVRSFVPRMVAGGDEGHLVLTASMAGITTTGFSGPYHVSKFGTVALAESLAHDLRSQGAPIGVSVLVPGAVNTAIGSSARNRPPELAPGVGAADAEFVDAALRDLAAVGRDPAEVGELVVAAVRAGEFWIPTTPSFDTQITSRYEDMLARRAPRSTPYD
jgi:NAD(P)-dependent dehydrogenase (short-subunit alcohol dehydrogenase family)